MIPTIFRYLLVLALSLEFVLQVISLHLFEEIVINDKHNYQEQLNSRLYSQYRQFSSKLFENSDLQLTNLHAKIATLPNCLNHIINYNGIDFAPFTTPVVLSRYDVIVSKYKVLSGHLKAKPTKPFTEWKRTFNYETVTRIFSNKSSEIQWCQRESWRHDLECFDIPFVDNSPKSKPWRCESHWYIFPPNSNEDPLFYELSAQEKPPIRLVIPASYKKFWSHALSRINNESDQDTRWNFLLKTRPIYDVIITHLSSEDINTIKAWSISLNVPYNSLFYQYTTTAREELTFSLEKSLVRNNQFELKETILFCRHCKQFRTFQPVRIGTQFSETNLSYIFANLNSNIDNSHWNGIFAGEWDEAIFTDSNKELLHTSSYNLLLMYGKDRKSKWIELEKVRYRFELRLIIQAIVRNGSFQTSHWWDYDQRRSHDVNEIPVELRYVAPCLAISEAGKEEAFRFRVHPMKLKFVSCGTAGHSGLAFDQLSSIFDAYIWMGIMFTTIIITWTCLYFRWFHHENLQLLKWKVLIAGFLLEYLEVSSVLLDQGLALPKNFLDFKKFRLAFAPFLLMAVILSSAYKHDNITKLTLPRDPIPFDTFDALTNYSFKIYTRINMIGGFQRYPLPTFIFDFLYRILKNSLVARSEQHQALFTPSELYLFSKGDYSHSLMFDDTSIILSNRTRHVLNHTKLHPDYISMAFNGTPTSLDVLRNCNQTALFLPDVEAHEAYYDLRNLPESRGKTYLSKESMFEVDSVIAFGRAVSPKVIDRMKGLEISGIYGWWTDFIVHYMTQVRGGRDQLTSNKQGQSVKSNLNGNISVVFVVLVVGLVASSFVFMGEIWKRLGRLVLRAVGKVVSLALNIMGK
ncbi:unnamed protein product [Orchesella dallaii]|uniref:Uncharacterized protein n=1 Tax=Orchesella dallaii TaxID=48710 RepID=A0ABP1S1S4_9HEXA